MKTRSAWIKSLLVSVVILIVSAVGFGVGQQHFSAADAKETYPSLKLFSDVLEMVEKNYIDETTTQKLVEDAIDGMVKGLDPHSSLLTPDELEELQIDTQGEFSGVGIQISMKDQFVTVIAPIDDTPAHRAGVKAGDRIVKVDDTEVKDLREAVKMIRGPRGSTVTITVLRESAEEPLEIEITRDTIPLVSVRSAILQPGYGYVRITNFNDDTTDNLTKALAAVESGDTPLNGLILDLRDNPGGLLDQSVKVADLFLEEGVIVSIKGRMPQSEKEYDAKKQAQDRHYPMVVLINGGSASASEIVAGALKDQKRALILGTTSFGKGSVQNVANLRDGYGLKLTIARYYTPSGESIQAKGIVPDIVIEPVIADPEKETSEQKKRRRFKEKDLENHLDAEGKSDGTPEKTDKKEADDAAVRGGTLSAEKLKADNQVSRALEILMGYHLLRKS